MQCERIQTKLTAYLEGQLDGDEGTVVRGHLRTCDACRGVASDEAALRDGLRALPPIDPPPSMWVGVQARLAAEEVAEAKRPAWKRALGRWSRLMPAPRFAMAGVLVAAAALGVVYWKTGSAEEAEPVAHHNTVIDNPPMKLAPDGPKKLAKRSHQACNDTAEPDDVTAALATDVARSASAYECAIEELLTETESIRVGWDDTERSAFEERVRTMRDALAAADDGKPRKRASKALVSYIQGATIRGDVLLAGGAR